MISKMVILIPILLKVLITATIASISLAIVLKSSHSSKSILEFHIPLIILIASDYLSSITTFINLWTLHSPKKQFFTVPIITFIDIISSGTGIYLINEIIFNFNNVISSSGIQIQRLLLTLTSLFMVSLLIRFYQLIVFLVQYTILSNNENFASYSENQFTERQQQYFTSPYPALHNYTNSNSTTAHNSYDIEKKSALSAGSETDVDTKNLYATHKNGTHSNSNSTAGDSYKTVNFKPSVQTLVASMAEKIPLDDLFNNYHNQHNIGGNSNDIYKDIIIDTRNSSTEDMLISGDSNVHPQIYYPYEDSGNDNQKAKVLESPKLLPTFTTPVQKHKVEFDQEVIPLSPTYNSDISTKISRVLNNNIETNCEISYIQTSPAKSKKSLNINDLGIQKGQAAILKSPEETTFKEGDSGDENTEIFDNDNDPMILGDLKQIPELINENWPQQTSSYSPKLEDSPMPKSGKNINHISLESWNKNSDLWVKNQIRMSGNHPNFYNKAPLRLQREISDMNAHLNLERPTLLRSYSEPSVVSTVDSIESPTPNNNLLAKYDQEFDNMSKLSIISRATDSNSKHDSLQSIVDKSFLTSYENISKLTMANKPNLSAPIMGKNMHHNSNSESTIRSRSRTTTITTPTDASPSSTVKHNRSHSNSPLKSLRSLKNLKSSLSLRLNKEESENNGNLFHDHTNSETESDINEMFTSFEYHGVSQRSSPQQKYHKHTKTKSSISLKTPTRKNSFKNSAGLSKSSSTRFNKIELEPLSSLSKSKSTNKFSIGDDADITNIEQMHSFDKLNGAGTPDSSWSGDSRQSTCPSVVIGQYDREKWRRIKNKLMEESTSSTAA